VRFGVLGALAVWTDDGRLVEVPEAKVRALLADLLLHLGHPRSADRLIDDLWGDDLPVHEAAFAAEFQNGRRLGSEQAPSDS
jgi:DNA-binding SARP family transcriptional activator